ncbi:unnamed protein product [Ilex paraguariensis]|uniref:Uncharacterized protein n=1 Tax=Ilex paraguariensis TaxID=185542 RepID=A0ABC8UBK3_9AQUA
MGKDGIWASKYTMNLNFPSGFSIARGPIFGSALKMRKVEWKSILGSQMCSSGKVTVLLEGDSDNMVVGGGSIEKEFEFKPSFDEYLKAMESVKSDREKRDEHNPNRRNLKNDSGGEAKKEMATDKIDCKDRGSRKVKDARKMGFEEGGNKGRTHSLVKVELDCKQSENFTKSKNGRWTNDQTSSVQGVERKDKFEGQGFKKDKVGLIRSETMGRLERNGVKGEWILQKKVAVKNPKPSRSNKFISEERGDVELEMERAAFKPLEEYNDAYDKPRVSRVDMEERILKLAKWLVLLTLDIYLVYLLL